MLPEGECRASSAQFGAIRSRTATVYYACELSAYVKVGANNYASFY